MAQVNSTTAPAPRITVIDPRTPERAKLRVAAYARVSSDSADQVNSYLAQVDYFTRYISGHDDWDMVDLYADDGISGLDAKKRDDFNRMMADCRDGKIDRILCKSISRFARNTQDYIRFMRELLRLGVTVCFEKENQNTLYMDNEMILTFFSQAQSESESLSSSVRCGFQARFKQGKVYYNYSNLLGYREGADGKPEIDEEQAAVVRRIFARYLMGNSVHKICQDLMADGIKTARGSEK